jgi:flagellar motor switch protein FliG
MSDVEAAKKVLDSIPGPARAAVLLMALGEQEAANVLKLMEPKEVQALGEAMASMNGVTQHQIRAVLDNFVGTIGNESSLSVGSQDYLKKLLTRALGREKANSMLSQISIGNGSRGLDALRWMHPRMVANVIRGEHPQIIAIVLAHLDREQAGEVLSLLPEENRTDILIRVAKLDTVHPAALSELDEIITRRFEENPEAEITGVGGVKIAAEILNGVNSDTESLILEKLKEIDAEMCDQIQESMFIFDNLLSVDDRGMQTLLREVSSDKLVIALKGAAPALQEKIFKNMSSRAAELLKDDLAAKGPVRLSEVEMVQKEILTIAYRLSEEGQIALGGKGDDFV